MTNITETVEIIEGQEAASRGVSSGIVVTFSILSQNCQTEQYRLDRIKELIGDVRVTRDRRKAMPTYRSKTGGGKLVSITATEA